MKAMILAAGLGTRLRPITERRPKALVEISGRTLLGITLAKLRASGVTEVIINVHHFAEMVVEYLAAHANFGMRIELSPEDVLLDTGGGLKKAAWFFREDANKRDEPFVMHNVDVLSSVDLRRMVQFHTEHHALATLAVKKRQASRYLLFDGEGQLCGWRSAREAELAPAPTAVDELGFSGIHVISPRLLDMLSEEGAFSIVTSYLRLAAQGQKILGFRDDAAYWRDLGRPEHLAQAEREERLWRDSPAPVRDAQHDGWLQG